MRAVALWAAAAAVHATAAAAAAAATCSLSGTWVDRSGNVASIDVAADGKLKAKSVYGGTSWKTAKGAAAADGLSLWIDFARGNQTGAVVSNCSAIWWGDGSVWGFAGDALDPVVTDVHLAFMAHLDLGYTDLMRNVCDAYFTSLLPASMALAAQLRGSATPYALTTHAFLLAEYLDGAAGCAHARPNATALAAMRAAIAAGDLRWHAQSANYFPEALDPPSFLAQLGVADGLNAAFNTSWGTLLMKSTDVAGLSRSVIPLLAAAGRRAVHMGTNAKITQAKVAQAFTWTHADSGTAVLALTTNDYGGWLVVPPHALFIQYQGDNGGPPTAAQVAGVYASAAAMFPGAAVKLSSLDDFTAAVVASPTAGQLRVVTSELGDSWLYGAPSDPVKMAVFRETLRALDNAVSRGGLSPADPDLAAFRRRLLIGGAEHNGGLSVGAYLPGARTPAGNWSNAQFHAVMARPDYAYMASSWAEKRGFLEPLPPASGSPSPAWTAFLADRAARVAPILAPSPPDVGPASGYAPVADPSAPVACGRLTATFNASTGWLASVVDAATGWQWAAPGGGGGLLGFAYRTYTEANFTTWNQEYTPACGVPCPNFAHVGMDSAHPVAAAWTPSLGALYLRRNGGGGGGGSPACEFAASLTMPPQTASDYGGAAALWLEVGVDADAASAHPQLAVRLSWFNKTATRMAESSWLSVTPNVGVAGTAGTDRGSASGSGSGWWLDVLGSDVDPLDVVLYGTRHAHAVGSRGFGYNVSSSSAPAFSVATLDALLVAPGDTDHLLHFDGAATPDVAGGGFHVNLHNNLWGTAFPQWFGDDAAFRFVVTLAAPANAGSRQAAAA